MTSVVTSESRRSSTLNALSGFSQMTPAKNLKKSSQPSLNTSTRPRTRSLVLKASTREPSLAKSTPNRRRKNKRGQGSRDGSPVIDLTTEEEQQPHMVLDGNEEEEEESPLRNTKRRKIAGSSGAALIRLASEELNLSPIKSSEKKAAPEAPPLVSSSPVNRKKIVTFSDDLVPSSPLKNFETPRKSILKNLGNFPDESSPLDPNNSSMWMKTTHSILHSFSTECHSPSNPSFWQPGTIIQLAPRSNDLPQLVDGCMNVLKAEKFNRKFEVYATLNQICKLNDASILADLLLGGDGSWLQHTEKSTKYKPRLNPEYIKELCNFIRRDITDTEAVLQSNNTTTTKTSPRRNNPFQSRVLNQALKVAAHLLTSPSVNRFIPIHDIQWFYSHTCERIVSPHISKSLVLPYLSIIKDCHFPPKKRRAIFETLSNPILEKMLSALLNIRNFGSSSLVNEKFIALKNMILNFPTLMAKNFHLWYVSLTLNLCDTTFPLYTKVVSNGVTALLEAARNFLDNPDICYAGRKFLESPLPQSQLSFTSDNLISVSTSPSTLTIDYVIENLLSLIQSGNHKFAMDIWVGITLLCGKFDNGFENWKYLTQWLQVHKYCFNELDITAKVTAISSWKVIVYKICCIELRDFRHTAVDRSTPNEAGRAIGTEDIFKTKIKLLIHIFINITSIESQKEIIDALHNSFMSILYCLFNYPAKIPAKLQDLYWDRIVTPVLANFYFRRDSSSTYMHRCGLDIVDRLVRATSSVGEKLFSSIRCLSNENIQLNEIHPSNPRWVFTRFDKSMQILSLVFKLDKLDIDPKLSLLANFMNTLKFSTKKEAQISDTTKDIIDNMPLTLDILSKHSRISYDSLFKLIVNLNDTFGAHNLMADSDIEASSCYEVLLLHSIQYYTTNQLSGIVNMIQGAVGDRFSMRFIYQLLKVNTKHKRGDLESFICDSLNTRQLQRLTNMDLIIAGRMFKYLETDFAVFAKKVIQHIVLLKSEEYERMVSLLEIHKWSNPIFKFYVSLMHDAPYDHLKQMSLSLLKQKWTSLGDFRVLSSFLFENKYDFEIIQCFDEILNKLDVLEQDERVDLEKKIKEYLLQSSEDDNRLDDLFVSATSKGIDILPDIKENLHKYPKLQSLVRKNMQPSMGVSQEKASNEAILQNRNELEPVVQSELTEHKVNNAVDLTGRGVTDAMNNSNSTQPNDDTRKESKSCQSQLSDNLTSEIRRAEPTSLSVNVPDLGWSSGQRRTRRMAAMERQELKCQKIVQMVEDRSPVVGQKSKRASSSLVVKGIRQKDNDDDEEIQEVETDDFSVENKNDSDSIEDSAETNAARMGGTVAKNSNVENKEGSNENEKQVSDSEESTKEKRLQEAHDKSLIEVNSSSDSHEKKSNDSMITNTSECQFPDSFAELSNLQSQDKNPNSTGASSCTDLMVLTHRQSQEPVETSSELLSVIEESTEEKNFATALIDRLKAVRDGDLKEVTREDQFLLETSMMEFILRMRRLKAQI